MKLKSYNTIRYRWMNLVSVIQHLAEIKVQTSLKSEGQKVH